MESLTQRTATVLNLFFHHAHRHCDTFHATHTWGKVIPLHRPSSARLGPVTALADAALQDATDFLSVYGAMLRGYVPELDLTPAYLAKDFLQRL